MDASRSDVADRERRLGDILAMLIEAAERGEPLDRGAWLARHLPFAAELNEYFDCEERLRSVAAPLRAAVGMDTPSPVFTVSVGEGLSSARMGQSIDGYEVLEEIGRGGMGVVFKARQKGANRLVALKLLRSDPLGEVEFARRLRHEAEVVAQLDHPNIVPLYEVGEGAGGLYFSMKLIEGGNLADHLPRFANDPRSVGRIVATIARAVHHAHQRGVLHRDLKPANILLGEDGQPYVTDFGLARRLEGEGSLTQSGALVGTPQYMAPEQTTGQRGAITTATDVYGLGAVLYSLLTGRPPHQGETLVDVVARVREREPEAPRSVNRRVDRDLETICLKCLEKAPSRRYASAALLAEDLGRWLDGAPIAARPATRIERLVKWVRRRPAAALSIGFLVLGFLGFAASTVLLYQANQEAIEARNLAWHRQRETEAERETAARQARTASAASSFLTDLFESIDPLRPEGLKGAARVANPTELPARALLDRGRERLRTRLQDDRLVRAALVTAVGNAYRNLGLLDEAEPLLQEGLALRQADLGDEHDDTCTSLHYLGCLRQDQGRFAEAETLLRRALALRQKVGGKDDLQSAAVMLNLAWVVWLRFQKLDRGQREEQEGWVTEAVRIRRLHLGQKHRDVATALTARAGIRLARGDMKGAMACLDEASEANDASGGEDWGARLMMDYSLAQVLRNTRRWDKSAALYRKLLDRVQSVLGETHPVYLLVLGDYAGLLRTKGDIDGGLKAIRRTLELSRRTPMRWHPAGIDARLELGDYEASQGNLAEAAKLYAEAADVARKVNQAEKVKVAEAKLAVVKKQEAGSGR